MSNFVCELANKYDFTSRSTGTLLDLEVNPLFSLSLSVQRQSNACNLRKCNIRAGKLTNEFGQLTFKFNAKNTDGLYILKKYNRKNKLHLLSLKSTDQGVYNLPEKIHVATSYIKNKKSFQIYVFLNALFSIYIHILSYLKTSFIKFDMLFEA